MTRTEQERWVERYLSGEMNSADEQEFFIQVAVDNNLRQTLKAYRIVESAIRKHRDAVPSRHAGLRSKVVDMLKVTAVAGPEPTTTPAAPTAKVFPRSGGAGLSPGMFKWIIAVVAAIGFTIAGFAVALFVGNAPGETTPSSGIQQQLNRETGAAKAPVIKAVPPNTTLPRGDEAAQEASMMPSEDPGAALHVSAAEGQEGRSLGRAARTPSSITLPVAQSSSIGGIVAAGEAAPATVPVSETTAEFSAQQVDQERSALQMQEPTLQRKTNDTLKVKMQFTPPQQR